MAWSILVGQLDTRDADNHSITKERAMRLLMDDLVAGGSAKRIGDTIFLNCKSNYCCIKDDGSIEYGESAA